jgi:hypothetical protein
MVAGRAHTTVSRLRPTDLPHEPLTTKDSAARPPSPHGSEAAAPLDAAALARRAALAVSLVAALVRALAVAFSRGQLFWPAARLLSAVNGLVLGCLIAFLRAVEEPPTYPPAEGTMSEGLVAAAALLFFAVVFGPTTRQRLAVVLCRTERGAVALAETLKVGVAQRRALGLRPQSTQDPLKTVSS